MSVHQASVVWERAEGAKFVDNRYSRSHRWEFDGGAIVPASASPAVVPVPLSDPAGVDPEEAFVASLSSCHMLWFLFFAAKGGFVVDSYRDAAAGHMEKTADGNQWMARVVLRPEIRFSGAAPDATALAGMHDKAHHACFIANSVKTTVTVEGIEQLAGRLFLVRHAHSDYTPDEMRALSQAGRRESQRVADLLEGHDVAAIVSSPYTRAIQTVQPLADRLGMTIEIDPDLRERHLASSPLNDFQASLEATWRNFDLVLPGGESSAAAQSRVSRTIHRIAATGESRDVVIATHGNALSLFLRTLDPSVDFAFWMRMSLPDVYAVATSPEGAWSYRRVWS